MVTKATPLGSATRTKSLTRASRRQAFGWVASFAWVASTTGGAVLLQAGCSASGVSDVTTSGESGAEFSASSYDPTLPPAAWVQEAVAAGIPLPECVTHEEAAAVSDGADVTGSPRTSAVSTARKSFLRQYGLHGRPSADGTCAHVRSRYTSEQWAQVVGLPADGYVVAIGENDPCHGLGVPTVDADYVCAKAVADGVSGVLELTRRLNDATFDSGATQVPSVREQEPAATTLGESAEAADSADSADSADPANDVDAWQCEPSHRVVREATVDPQTGRFTLLPSGWRFDETALEGDRSADETLASRRLVNVLGGHGVRVREHDQTEWWCYRPSVRRAAFARVSPLGCEATIPQPNAGVAASVDRSLIHWPDGDRDAGAVAQSSDTRTTTLRVTMGMACQLNASSDLAKKFPGHHLADDLVCASGATTSAAVSAVATGLVVYSGVKKDSSVGIKVLQFAQPDGTSICAGYMHLGRRTQALAAGGTELAIAGEPIGELADFATMDAWNMRPHLHLALLDPEACDEVVRRGDGFFRSYAPKAPRAANSVRNPAGAGHFLSPTHYLFVERPANACGYSAASSVL
jgi:hypothetical protein